MAGNYSAAYSAPPRKKIAIENIKLTLSAPCPSAPGKVATLRWRLVNNNPRIIVYTNDPADMSEKNKNGLISAELDAVVFNTILSMLDSVIENPEPTRIKIENKNFIFPGGKRSEKPIPLSEIFLIKDAEGVIYISVLSTNPERPKIKFPLLANDFHHFFNGDGTPLSKGDASKYFAKGYVRTIRDVMNQLLVTEWVEPKPAEPKGNSGSGNRRPAPAQANDFDDELGF